MTSGIFKSVPIASITIERGTRQRRELTGLEELAESIRKSGLINPPVVDENNVLVAGERRLTACRDILGWTSIPVQFTRDCSPDQLHLIELEENVRRVDLSWQDQCHAVAEYHNLCASMTEGWTARATAKGLGIKESEVSDRRAVASALDSGMKLVVEADRYSTARGIVKRNVARKVSSASDQLESMMGGQPAAPTIQYSGDPSEYALPEAEALPAAAVPFRHCDFADFAASYRGPAFNFLHCDFPYGISMQSSAASAASSYGSYDDDEDVYWNLLSVLAEAMPDLVADSAHMMFWFSMDFYSETRERLQAMGWVVNPFPLIWHKTDNSGIMPDPKRGPRRIYETAFLCSRGERFVAQPVANVYGGPNTKTIHMSEKPQAMLAHFFRMFVDESTIMLDPTMGSGNAVVAAQLAGAHSALGLERDETFYDAAVAAYLAREA